MTSAPQDKKVFPDPVLLHFQATEKEMPKSVQITNDSHRTAAYG